MRNIVGHEYAPIDHQIVRNALADRLPETASAARGILTGGQPRPNVAGTAASAIDG